MLFKYLLGKRKNWKLLFPRVLFFFFSKEKTLSSSNIALIVTFCSKFLVNFFVNFFFLFWLWILKFLLQIQENGMALLRRLWKWIIAGTTRLASTLRYMNQLQYHDDNLLRENSTCMLSYKRFILPWWQFLVPDPSCS